MSQQHDAGGDDRVRRAIAGDADCLEALVRDAAPVLRRSLVIDARWNRSLDADDVLQVTFLEAFLRIRSLETCTVAGFHAWLHRIAEHNLLDAVRALGRDKRADEGRRVTRGPAGESSRTLLLAVAGENRTAGGAAVLAEEIARLHAAIGQLPASYRTVSSWSISRNGRSPT